jgi:hypothetical protein
MAPKDYNYGSPRTKRGLGPYTEGVRIRPDTSIDDSGNPVDKPKSYANVIEGASRQAARRVRDIEGNDGLAAAMPKSSGLNVGGGGITRGASKPSIKRYVG